MKSRNIRFLIEYDGTPYAGWQLQPGLATVQGTIQEVLAQITREPDALLHCAGRTDAGVHAYGQVAHFFTDYRPEARRLAPALNRFLPESIRIHRAEEMPFAFDSRHDARGKRYRYRVYEGPHTPALDKFRAWHVRRHINVDHVRAAASFLVGELDFESYRSAHCQAAHAVRTMHSITVTEEIRPPVGRIIDITFHANAFCRHMCRILAGTLVEAGTGERTVQSVQDTLDQRNRCRGGVTAPPWGLTMLEVFY